MRKRRLTTTLLGGVVIIGSLAFAAGCEEREGPAEKAGKAIDRAVEDAKDAIHPPGPAEKAGRALDRAVDQ